MEKLVPIDRYRGHVCAICSRLSMCFCCSVVLSFNFSYFATFWIEFEQYKICDEVADDHFHHIRLLRTGLTEIAKQFRTFAFINLNCSVKWRTKLFGIFIDLFICYQTHLNALTLWPDDSNRIVDIDGLTDYITTLRKDPKFYPGIVDELLKALNVEDSFYVRESNSLREKWLVVGFGILFHFNCLFF